MKKGTYDLLYHDLYKRKNVYADLLYKNSYNKTTCNKFFYNKGRVGLMDQEQSHLLFVLI